MQFATILLDIAKPLCTQSNLTHTVIVYCLNVKVKAITFQPDELYTISILNTMSKGLY